MKTLTRTLTAIATLTAAGLILVAPAAMAKDYPDGGVTGDEVAADLKALGQKATVGKDSTGDPMIDASFPLNTTDINYKLFFFGCNKGPRCTSVQYHVAFDGDVKKIPEWNKTYRFARAYATDATTIHIEYDVDFEKGANTKAVQNSAERWKAIMVQSVTFLSPN